MENPQENRSSHSLLKGAARSKTSLSTIPEETRSHVTDVANSVSSKEVSVGRSSTSIALQKKMVNTSRAEFMKKSNERMLSRRVSVGSVSDEKKKWEAYQIEAMNKEHLFPTTVKDDTKPASVKSKESKDSFDTSFLVTGFGMRNLESLQNALDRERRMMELVKTSQLSIQRDSVEADSFISDTNPTSNASTSTSDTTLSFDKSFEKQRLEYLMGLSTIAQAEEEYPEEKLSLEALEEESAEEPITGTTIAMRQAQKYLRTHKIFEFFQFLISHMLSAIPDNPVEFLIELLDKCLLYRSGFCEAPLLYTKLHIEQLFYLMDKMRSGFIELEQYHTGMKTLGICSYNKNPSMTYDGLVPKNIFIEEAYEGLINHMNDMTKRWKEKQYSVPTVPPPTPCSTYLSTCRSGPHPTPRTYSMFPEG